MHESSGNVANGQFQLPMSFSRKERKGHKEMKTRMILVSAAAVAVALAVKLAVDALPDAAVACGFMRPAAEVCHLRRHRPACLRRRRAHRHGKVENEHRHRHHDIGPLPRRSSGRRIFRGECRV